ncbi:hypothetical protein ACB098_09G169700 [Castanea mollissima]
MDFLQPQSVRVRVNDNKSYLFGLVFYLDNEVKYCFQNFQVIHITMQDNSNPGFLGAKRLRIFRIIGYEDAFVDSYSSFAGQIRQQSNYILRKIGEDLRGFLTIGEENIF